MYDIHCHISYGVDDGSQTLEESIKMVEQAYARGTKGIVATPHSNIPDSYQNYWSKEMFEKVATLRTSLKQSGIDTKIFCGQEIFYTDDTLDLLKSGKLITINNSKYPLIEFSFDDKADTVYDALKTLLREGYIPIVAHPERYDFISEDTNAIYKLKSLGCLLQINKGSITGGFGETAMENAFQMLETRQADFIASDAHSPYMRTTNLDEIHEIICEEYSYDYAKLLLKINPAMVLQNSETYVY